jgi:hypothetical protein
MASLTGTDKYLDTYYKDILHMSNSALGLDGTIRYLYDGAGTASVLGLSTTGVTVNGTFKISTGTFVSGGAFTYTFPAFSGTMSTLAGTETLTNKSINLANNTLTGTTAEFNTALSDGNFATLAGSEALTNKTYNGLTITSSTGTLTVTNGKTLSVSNTLTFTGTDASSVAFGTGGTVTYTSNKLSAFSATTSAELAGVISDETGSGALVFGTSPTITTPTINGVTDASSAAAGVVGQVISSEIATGSAVALTNITSANITSIALTAGDWDVYSTVVTKPASGTTTASVTTGISTTSATLPTHSLSSPIATTGDGGASSADKVHYVATMPARINVSGNTTVYLVANVAFAVSTMAAYGSLWARRAR